MRRGSPVAMTQPVGFRMSSFECVSRLILSTVVFRFF